MWTPWHLICVASRLRVLIDSLMYRFAWCIKKIEEWIRIMIRLGGESILSWFGWAENRYYHDSVGRRIDTIMIRLDGESILSWFGWVVNRYYHDSQIPKRIDSNQSIKSMKIKKIDLNRFYQWSVDVNRFFCDLRGNVDPKQLIKPRGSAILYCTCTVPYRIVPYRKSFIFCYKIHTYGTVPYRTVLYNKKLTYHTVPILYMYRAIITRIKLAR